MAASTSRCGSSSTLCTASCLILNSVSIRCWKRSLFWSTLNLTPRSAPRFEAARSITLGVTLSIHMAMASPASAAPPSGQSLSNSILQPDVLLPGCSGSWKRGW
ncbi:hypothetical protein E2C01_041677 [Portunus trituberculatus]|uniref:Uncharacterized protein n=1 Tax=Portunus trituberculatus TaxID=210409 RepID=A0A5B7FR02_PORTR|nr:hypothetical protein [Portunus trituberculatus]